MSTLAAALAECHRLLTTIGPGHDVATGLVLTSSQRIRARAEDEGPWNAFCAGHVAYGDSPEQAGVALLASVRRATVEHHRRMIAECRTELAKYEAELRALENQQ